MENLFNFTSDIPVEFSYLAPDTEQQRDGGELIPIPHQQGEQFDGHLTDLSHWIFVPTVVNKMPPGALGMTTIMGLV